MNMAYDNVKQVIEEYGIAKKQFEEKMKNAFTDIFETFFRNYPEITAVGWNQYTPYFNDGDPCEFRIGEFVGVSEGMKNEDGEPLNLDDVRSAYDLEEAVGFPYGGKPSQYVYDNRHEYSSYEESIQIYEKGLAENSRYREICEGWNELTSVLSSIPDEIFQSAFDDHAFVIATKDDIEVREYSHD